VWRPWWPFDATFDVRVAVPLALMVTPTISHDLAVDPDVLLEINGAGDLRGHWTHRSAGGGVRRLRDKESCGVIDVAAKTRPLATLRVAAVVVLTVALAVDDAAGDANPGKPPATGAMVCVGPAVVGQ